jgi:hypothetical protein
MTAAIGTSGSAMPSTSCTKAMVRICPAGATPDLRKGGYFDRFLELQDIVQLR